MYLEDDYLYADRLKTAQKSAREKGLGIWKNKPIDKEEKKEEPVKEEKSKSFLDVIIGFFIDVFNAIISFIDSLIDNIF